MTNKQSSEPDPSLYRPNVGIAVFGHDGRVFVGKRIDAPEPYQWQMPQGGIDEGETPLQAAYRELHEEIGVEAHLVKMLGESAHWITYDFPPDIRGKMGKRSHFLGQMQKWFAFRFEGSEADIRLDVHEQEFCDWRWELLERTPDLVIPFKRAAYETIALEFKKYVVGGISEDG